MKSIVHRKMLEVLGDGEPHTTKELHACLYDTDSPLTNIRPHLTMLRKVLRPKGEDIICQIMDGITYYRWIRLLASSYDGRV